MEILIIILIVVLIVQTVLFIVSSFIDRNREKQAANATKIWEDAQRNFVDEKAKLYKISEQKDDVIKQWIEKYNQTATMLHEERKVNGLLKNRTAYIEGLKDSFNLAAENRWEMRKYIPLNEGKTDRQCFVDGMKEGAEWIAGFVGVNIDFEIDERHTESESETE